VSARPHFKYRTLNGAFGSYLRHVVTQRANADLETTTIAGMDFYSGAEAAMSILLSHVQEPGTIEGLVEELDQFHRSMRDAISRMEAKGRTNE
jgi:hypothetical protein